MNGHDTQSNDDNVNKSPSWLSGGGHMGEVVRNKNWATTPLGSINAWPQSLRTTVSLCIASNFPISIAWGPQRIQIYNDGYWPICADKHPYSMGQDFKECWFSAWPVIGEAFERASKGETCFLVNQRMFLDRLGYLEETFFTFSFSPIQDESGGVGGLFHPVTELTQQSLAERRLRILRNLTDRNTNASSTKSALHSLMDTLKESFLDVPFALFYRLKNDGKEARLVQCYGLDKRRDLRPKSQDLRTSTNAVWPLAKTLQQNFILIDDLIPRYGSIAIGPYKEPPGSAVIQQILLPGMTKPFGFLITGISSRRPWDEAYHTFYEMLGEAVSNILGKARSYELEYKRAEMLAELDRAKTAFFSNVSHEFRTPLTLMLGPVEELLDKNDDTISSSTRSLLQGVSRNGLRLLRLVNSLLEFSRIEAGHLHASYEPTDLAAYTEDLASSFRSATEQAGLQLLVDCPPLQESVFVDREKWEKIVLNLLSNAFKFTFEGIITVTLRQIGQQVELCIQDTGVGIPPNEINQVFDRFHRGENVQSRTHEGTGIGLSLVKELVKLHGGTIRVESRLNDGSSFFVTIPLSTEHLPTDCIQSASSASTPKVSNASSSFVEEALQWLPSERRSETKRKGEINERLSKINLSSGKNENHTKMEASRPQILLADDNADMCTYVSRILSTEFDVTIVTDGKSALAAIMKHPFDLIISDVMMPHLDGFELLEKLRNDASVRTIPVILLTARAGEESRVDALERGADDYLVKPFSARELKARVDGNLKLQRLRREASSETHKFISLVENSTDFIGMADLQYRPIFINSAGLSMVGLDTVNEAQLKFVKDFYFPDDHPFILNEFIPQVLREGRGETEIRFRHFKTNQGIWMLCNIFQLQDIEGNTIGLATVSRNITERKEKERQLNEWKDTLEVRIEERTRELVSSQNRLRSLASQLSLTELRERAKLANDLHDYLAQLLVVGRMKLSQAKPLLDQSPEVEQIVYEIDHVFEQALTYSRTTISELKPPNFQEKGLIQPLELLSEQMKKHGLLVTLSTSDDRIFLPEGHAVALFQSIRELLFNVLKHANVDQATINVTTPNEDEIHVTVEDRGTGLGPNAMQRALDPGHLGLFAVQERIEALNGFVDIFSKEGHGTRVVLVLPIAPSTPASATTNHSNTTILEAAVPHGQSLLSSLKTSVSDRIRVLVVDDNTLVRNELLRALKTYSDLEIVGEAENGEVAVRLSLHLQPDVIIMDINMPKMNGIEATRQIFHQSPHIKILGLSINHEQTMIKAFLAAGAVQYLNKNGTIEEIHTAICSAYSNKG